MSGSMFADDFVGIIRNTRRIAETYAGGPRVHQEMESVSERKKLRSGEPGEPGNFQTEVGRRRITDRRPVYERSLAWISQNNVLRMNT